MRWSCCLPSAKVQSSDPTQGSVVRFAFATVFVVACLSGTLSSAAALFYLFFSLKLDSVSSCANVDDRLMDRVSSYKQSPPIKVHVYCLGFFQRKSRGRAESLCPRPCFRYALVT